MTGNIKTKTDKGFGFISRDGEEKDLFFHSNDLMGVTFDELQVGETVTFEIVNGEKGPSAKKVTRATAAAATPSAEAAPEATEAVSEVKDPSATE